MTSFPPDPGRDAGIDGLRAAAMTMVIAQHCGLLPFGWIGVWLFYVISGYVIARGFEAGAAAGPDAQMPPGRWLRAFWRRRAARLLPAYGLYLLLNLVVLGWTGRAAPLADLPWLLSFTHNWLMSVDPFGQVFSGWPPFGHLWTLSVEQQFYLVFPLLWLCLPVGPRTWLSVALILLGPLLRWAWAAWLQAQGLSDGRVAFGVYAASHVQFDAFLMGSLLARAQAAGALDGAQMRRWSTRLWWLAAAAGLVYACSYVGINLVERQAQGVQALRDVFSGVMIGQGRQAWVYSVVSLGSLALLLHVVAGRAGSRWLAGARWAEVGQASYSGYLFHLLVLWLIGEALGQRIRELALTPRLAAFALAWAITVWLALLSWRHFERPVMRWLKGPSTRPAQPMALA